MNKAPRLALMVAMAQNRCIGVNNTLPWHLPEDLKHFKKTTTGKPVIMGRKTYDSIGRPLPNRTNIVIARNAQWQAPGVEVAANLADAVALGLVAADIMAAEEIVIMGGAQVYTEVLNEPLAQNALALSRMYLTRVHADVDGDAFFPKYDETQWQLKSTHKYAADSRNPYAYSFETWDKK